MNLAVMCYSFHTMVRDGRMNAFGYLETCKYRYGLATADLWNGFLASNETDYVQTLKEAVQERGLAVVNYAVDGAHLWVDDAAQREQHHKNGLTALQVGEALGATTVRIDAGGGRNAQEFTNQEFDFVVKRYQEYAQRAHDNGYKVGPENHWGPTMTPAVMRRLCEAVDHPGFGILLHMGRWHNDTSVKGDEMVAPWTVHTHFGRAVFDDTLNSRVSVLKNANYQGSWSIEHPSESYSEVGGLLESLKQSMQSQGIK